MITVTSMNLIKLKVAMGYVPNLVTSTTDSHAFFKQHDISISITDDIDPLSPSKYWQLRFKNERAELLFKLRFGEYL